MKQTITRVLKIKLPKGQSAFLWGPRKTGKTTFLKAAFPDSLSYDLLQTDLFFEFVKRPFLLREQLLAAAPKHLREPVIIDEVQKVPQLLDEIHWLIENKNLRFILCGSSARKLKRGKANLLGGRAWRRKTGKTTFLRAAFPDSLSYAIASDRPFFRIRKASLPAAGAASCRSPKAFEGAGHYRRSAEGASAAR